VFGWALAEGIIAVNPVRGIGTLVKERPRDRVLDDRELVAFWHGCERIGWPYDAIFRLLLATGQRLREVADLRWAELDLDEKVWVLPPGRAKMKRAHIIHLSRLAVGILETAPRVRNDFDLVFPSPRAGTPIASLSDAKARLDAALPGVASWALHDLRRSA